MRTALAIFLVKWSRKIAEVIIFIINLVVFFVLDFLDCIMCITYRYIDEFLEGESTPSCYCRCRTQEVENGGMSETLYGRKNVFRDMGLFNMPRNGCEKGSKKIGGLDLGKTRSRWSDCGCESCVSWMSKLGDQKLHVVVKEPSQGNLDGISDFPTENVIFLHGFLSSSLFWTETVFPYLSESLKSSNYKFFAVDLLGFGSSPKPMECFYTLSDHLEMVDKSVIREFKLTSFHLVAHSMGCMIALALAAKYPNNIKSITLIAPPYFSSSDGDASSVAFRRLAYKSFWPPLLFGAAFMSWYEHLGRCVCFVVCRNHRTWERFIKLITRKSKLHFLVIDLTRHTHHSAWHTMHNVICGGAKLMDPCLETLSQAQARITVIQGSQDQVVPVECSSNIKVKVPNAEVRIVENADHNTVLLGREKEFARDLELIWASATDVKSNNISGEN